MVTVPSITQRLTTLEADLHAIDGRGTREQRRFYACAEARSVTQERFVAPACVVDEDWLAGEDVVGVEVVDGEKAAFRGPS